MYRSNQSGSQVSRRGFVLIAVMVVVVLLSLASYQFAFLMSSEYQSATSASREAQAHSLAEGGIDYFIANVSNPNLLGQQVQAQITSNVGTVDTAAPPSWTLPNVLNNQALFQGITVDTSDGSTPQGRFSIVAPIGPDEIGNNSAPFHFGATDEGGKINLNAMMQLDPSGTTLSNMLTQLQTIALPNLNTNDINSILDWMDTDDQPRTGGAEDTYYQSLSPAYHCKNGPLDSLEELLLVQGMTPSLVMGNDRNRNGVLDPGEDDGTGQLSYGLSGFVTVYSHELNISANGQPRIYINAGDLNQLQTDLTAALGEDLASYIVAYRQYGPASTGGGGGGGGKSGGGSGGSGGSAGGGTSGAGSGGSAGGSGGSGGGGKGGNQISSLFKLINSSVSVPASGTSPATTMQSPLNDPSQQAQLLPLLLDQCTTVNSPEIPARINVNTAPLEVIESLPNIQASDAQNIIANQPNPTTSPQDPTYATTAWLVTVAGLSPTTLQSLEKYITASSQVYRVQSIGYFDQGGPSARIEAVVDTNGGMPRILYWRDLTELGSGFDLQAISGQ